MYTDSDTLPLQYCMVYGRQDIIMINELWKSLLFQKFYEICVQDDLKINGFSSLIDTNIAFSRARFSYHAIYKTINIRPLVWIYLDRLSTGPKTYISIPVYMISPLFPFALYVLLEILPSAGLQSLIRGHLAILERNAQGKIVIELQKADRNQWKLVNHHIDIKVNILFPLCLIFLICALYTAISTEKQAYYIKIWFQYNPCIWFASSHEVKVMRSV